MTGRGTRSRADSRRAAVVFAVLLAITVAASLPASAAAPPTRVSWRYLLDRAAQAAEEHAYTGEVLWVSYVEEGPDVSTFQVRSSGDGTIKVSDANRFDFRLGASGSALADYERGWYLPLPPADLARVHKGLPRLDGKYRVAVVGKDALLDRPATKLEISRAADKQLMERLWVDDASGLLLRREMYGAGKKLLRMAVYLRLDLNAAGQDPQPPARGQTVRRPAVQEVDDTTRLALPAAGWLVPEALPGSYLPDASFTVSADDSQSLQMVYGDGLYTVSVFQQLGEPDSATLPDGVETSDALGFPAYTWPGAVPTRYVWEAEGRTFSIIGDAPPDDLRAIAASLPQPHTASLLERLQRGLGRLWSWVSPWD
jgi:sigma-E factor negative regulatory protein RseB